MRTDCLSPIGVRELARWEADDSTLESVSVVDVVSMDAGIRLATRFKGEARRVSILMLICGA